MLRSWIAAECLRTLARFCLLVTIAVSSRTLAADEPAQVVPLIEMPAKVVERIEEAIHNYPSQGRDPENFRQKRARTNATQALEKIRKLRWPDYSKLQLVTIEDLDAECPSPEILVAWITPPADDRFRLLSEANELLPLSSKRYRVKPFALERFWAVEQVQLGLKDYGPDSEPIGLATNHPKDGIMSRGQPDAMRIFNFVYLAATFEKTEDLTRIIDRELDAGPWGNQGPFSSAWQSWHERRVAHGHQLLLTGTALPDVLDYWRETARLFGDAAPSPLISRVEQQIAEGRGTNNLDADAITRLTLDEQVRYWIDRLPDDRGQTGHALTMPFERESATNGLRKLGWHAVPQLIAAMRDTRLTRMLHTVYEDTESWNSPAQVVRVQDVATQMLREFFYEEQLFRPAGQLLSSKSEQVQAEVIAKVEAWWTEHGQETERAWWLSRLERQYSGNRIHALEMLEQLDPTAVDGIATLQGWVNSAEPRDVVLYCDQLRQRGFTGPIPPLDKWLRTHRDTGYQKATSLDLVRHGDMQELRFLQQCLRMKVPTQFTSDVRTRMCSGLANSVPGQWYGGRNEMPRMNPSAIPLFVDLLDRDRLVGLPGRQETNTITEIAESQSALIILQELTGHTVNFDRAAALSDRKAAMDQWLAWWHETGRADYLGKHPEAAPLFADAWKTGDTGDVASLPELVDAEDPREFCRITYRIPRASVARLVAESSLLVNTVPQFADRFRFATAAAAEKWFRGEAIVSGNPLPCVIIPIADTVAADTRGRIWCRWDLFGYPPAMFENGIWTTFTDQRLPNSWTSETSTGRTSRETQSWETIERLWAGDQGAMFFPSSFHTQCGQKTELRFDLLDSEGWLRFSVSELPKHPSIDRILKAIPRGRINSGDHRQFTRDDSGRIYTDENIVEKGKVILKSARLPGPHGSYYTRRGLIGNGDVWLAQRHDFQPFPFGVDQFVALTVEQGELIEKSLPLSPQIGPPLVWVNEGPVESTDPARNRDRSVTVFDSNGNVVARHAGHLVGVDATGGRWLVLGPRGAVESVQRIDAAGEIRTWKHPAFSGSDVWSESSLNSAFATDDSLWLPVGQELVHLRLGESEIELVDRFPLPEEGWKQVLCDPSGDVWMTFQDHKNADRRLRLYRFATHSRSRGKP